MYLSEAEGKDLIRSYWLEVSQSMAHDGQPAAERSPLSRRPPDGHDRLPARIALAAAEPWF